MKTPRVFFSPESLPFILEVFNMKVNKDGYLFDIESGEMIRDVWDEIVKAENIIAIGKRGIAQAEVQLEDII